MEEAFKLNDAMRRANPVSRMTDYGMDRLDAEWVHSATVENMGWVDALESLAEKYEVSADVAESVEAGDLWHRASACLVFAQMAFNFDVDKKREIYSRHISDFSKFARSTAVPVRKVELDFSSGTLFGWQFSSRKQRLGMILVGGGLSGWATAYRSMAEALCAEGIDCLLIDAPGQGETRMSGGIYAGSHTVPGIRRFIDFVQAETRGEPIGVWGNSFGGLFAALSASNDPRIRACCINGAPASAEPPPYRTPTEQLAAVLGMPSLDGAEDQLATLAFRGPIPCPVLVVEGGADALAPPSSQDVFLVGNIHPRSTKLIWADGLHTIYNHAAERNHKVASWFANTFRGNP